MHLPKTVGNAKQTLAKDERKRRPKKKREKTKEND